MSKLTDKLIVAALIGVLILIAGFITVQAASLTTPDQARSTVLSSSLNFPIQEQSLNAAPETSSEPLVPAAGEKGEGHDCESEAQVNPEE